MDGINYAGGAGNDIFFGGVVCGAAVCGVAINSNCDGNNFDDRSDVCSECGVVVVFWGVCGNYNCAATFGADFLWQEKTARSVGNYFGDDFGNDYLRADFAVFFWFDFDYFATGESVDFANYADCDGAGFCDWRSFILADFGIFAWKSYGVFAGFSSFCDEFFGATKNVFDYDREKSIVGVFIIYTADSIFSSIYRDK